MIRVTFGILALNAQPLLEYNLRALYPFAHEIIVVEGATRPAASLAGPEGHSTDDTLTFLNSFRNLSDPQKKIRVVTALDEEYADGFWPEKDEMSRAYAERATGDWLWQVDSDEFYKEEDMRSIYSMLENDPTVTAVSFPYLEFFGSFSSHITGVWHLYEHPLFHRLFRWGSGYAYKSHRPPTVVDKNGADLRQQKWVSSPMNGKSPIFLYHYSYVFPKQAEQKVGYYTHVEWTKTFRHNQRWMQEEYLGLKHPMFLSERGTPFLQWLERYSGGHPKSIEQLRSDLASGKVREPMRSIDDIERLLSSPIYYLERVVARAFLALYWPLRALWKQMRAHLFFGHCKG